jgi:hypothetical protein
MRRRGGNDESISRTGATILMRVSILTSTRALGVATSILVAACGAGDPSGPNAPQTLFTYRNAVAYLPPGIAEYKAAIVFLPGLRDPATGNPLDSRGLVRGTAEGTCSIWCLTNERAEVRSRALELAGGNVALIGTTTLLDDATGYATLLEALSELGTQSQHPELANIPVFFVGHSMGDAPRTGSAAFTAPE